MVNPINGHRGQAVYVNQAVRNAWREEMLEKALQKVREVSATVETAPKRVSHGPPPKGSLLDTFA